MNAKNLYKLIDDAGRALVKAENLGEITELIHYGNEGRIVFSINWFNTITITFRPKTISLKICKSNKSDKDIKAISKSYPLEQEDMLKEIFEQYKALT